MTLSVATSEDVNELRAQVQDLTATVASLARLIQGAEREWMTIAQAAEYFDCSVKTINRRVQSGELTARGHGALRQVRVR